jgi:hypothetical protein
LGALHELAREHEGRVDFAVVYIYEAHPEDGWVVTMNRNQGVMLDQPESDSERAAVAESCAIRLEISLPVVIDPIDNRIASAYGALPDRLYLIGRGGHVAFQGEPGPWGFRVEDLAAAIDSELARIDE